MSRTTLANAKAELVALFGDTSGVPVASLTALNVAHVYNGEPRQVLGPLSVSVATTRMNATDWTFTVRLYAKADDDPQAAQSRIDLALPALDALLMTDDGFGPLNWDIAWVDELQAFVAAATLDCGRNDLG